MTAAALGKPLASNDFTRTTPPATAIPTACSDVVQIVDVDGQALPAKLVQLLARLGPGVDLVHRSERSGTNPAGAKCPPDRVGDRFMNGLDELFLGLAITDSQPGVRAARRERLATLALTARECQTGMSLRGALTGCDS